MKEGTSFLRLKDLVFLYFISTAGGHRAKTQVTQVKANISAVTGGPCVTTCHYITWSSPTRAQVEVWAIAPLLLWLDVLTGPINAGHLGQQNAGGVTVDSTLISRN